MNCNWFTEKIWLLRFISFSRTEERLPDIIRFQNETFKRAIKKIHKTKSHKSLVLDDTLKRRTIKEMNKKIIKTHIRWVIELFWEYWVWNYFWSKKAKTFCALFFIWHWLLLMCINKYWAVEHVSMESHSLETRHSVCFSKKQPHNNSSKSPVSITTCALTRSKEFLL